MLHRQHYNFTADQHYNVYESLQIHVALFEDMALMGRVIKEIVRLDRVVDGDLFPRNCSIYII